MLDVTDAEIIALLTHYRQMATYHLKNCLREKHKGIKTDFVRRRLMKLEIAGAVQRAQGSSTVQIIWGLAPAKEPV